MLRTVPDKSPPACPPRKRALPPGLATPPCAPKQLRRSDEQPLDMSQRAAVPQARPSVITCAARCRTGASARDTDPIVEAHFRRSLGSQYAALFATPSAASEASVTATCLHSVTPTFTTWQSVRASSFTALQLRSRRSGLRRGTAMVDDHFAKALGDTWRRLQDQEPQGVTS
ncbi:uncharacterized protein LOC8037796 [Ixodes scapularis]|uniref:uncharacterized protein LOC8037796 n=1 Tax=Ixodes scapularis TaxID=6945 RepID=UPI001161650E|nr:uncharacterized protein LOC8037796 [Ixodes scapularis]